MFSLCLDQTGFKTAMMAAVGLVGAVTINAQQSAVAQINTDGTLATTVTSADNRNFLIEGGSTIGNHLFHSFNAFSIPFNGSAHFNNTTDINIIFSRVTGGEKSTLEGMISTNGTTDLFFINPSGIVFGENASLQVGGSFMATTAESVVFTDGTEFSASYPTTGPILTVRTPLGLNMGTNPAAIQVNGSSGHLSTGGFPDPPVGISGDSVLEVGSGSTLALIGGEIALDRGVLQAPSGRIELGAIGDGNRNAIVVLSRVANGWIPSYQPITTFASIRLTNKSLLDISGRLPPLGMTLVGDAIDIHRGSWLLANNFGDQSAGTIALNAIGDLTMSHQFVTDRMESRILSYGFAEGDGSHINITARNITLQDGSFIFANTLGSGNGGTLTIQAQDALHLTGTNELGASQFSQSTIAADTFGLGAGGSVNIEARDVTLLTAGQIVSLTTGAGAGGNVVINATDSVALVGTTPMLELQSDIRSTSFGPGDAGNVEINTGTLLLQNGGVIEASSQGMGASGNIFLNASEIIDIRGQMVSSERQTVMRSEVRASTVKPERFIQEIFGLGPVPSGRAGSVVLNAPMITLTNEGGVTTVNEGVGDGGTITIRGRRLDLAHQASLLATTESGTGGSMSLELEELVVLREQSRLNAASLMIGNGGNITIASPLIVGSGNSDIVANAVQGNGGNITIMVQGLLGLEFRDRLTPQSDITASSVFGVDGTVEINGLEADPGFPVLELPDAVINIGQLVQSVCSFSLDKNQFVMTGRGGLSMSLMELMSGDRPWIDIRDPLAAWDASERDLMDWDRGERNEIVFDRRMSATNIDVLPLEISSSPEPIREATGMAIASDGTVQLLPTTLPSSGGPFRSPSGCTAASISQASD